MKTILVINDQTKEADHAVKFALVLAQRIHVNIILATTVAPKAEELDYGWTGITENETIVEPAHGLLMKRLIWRKKNDSDFCPVIKEVELTDNRDSLFLLAIKNDIYMVVMGMDEFRPQALFNVNVAIDTLLNKLQVPLLLVPSSWREYEFKRMVYLTDLRFCCLQTAKFLAGFAEKWKANLVIAHTSVSGLPELELKDAEDIFNDAVSPNLNYGHLLLNVLDKNDQPNAVEIIVGRMKADLLVLVNQHFYFNALIKQYFKDKCLRYKPTPVLIFPS